MPSKTECRTLKTIFHHELGQLSLLKVKLHTGRMHQIRIHLASEGYPVLGDNIYGNPALHRKLGKILPLQKQLLHCWNYHFVDHLGRTITITAPIPAAFITLFPDSKHLTTASISL
jgi:23S rRNA pseudouridine955/2504/2580 synthase